MITRKSTEPQRIAPNLSNYEATCRAFSWDSVRNELQGLPEDTGLNIAHEAVDAHAVGPCGSHTALRWLGKNGSSRELTYRQLASDSARMANVLRYLGVRKGGAVFSLMGRVPELYLTALGTLKNAAVFCPLFSRLGPSPVCQRLLRGDARVLVTTSELYEEKVSASREDLPFLQYVLLVDANRDRDPYTLSLSRLMSEAGKTFIIPATDPEDVALLHFTSGTTGMPKGAVHVHQAALTHYIIGKYVLDLHPGDVFWCTADPGWVTGTSYGILAPLLLGVTNLVDEADFDATRWYRILQDQKVTVWCTDPTVIRRLMRIPGKPCEQYDLGALRLIHSVGETLNPEAVIWGKDLLGLPILDHWWQTETGGIMIANYASMEIRPGSMGKPLPGIESAIVRHVGDTVEVVTETGVEGELALKPGWPSMFRSYLHDEARYAKCFVNNWYLTGDLARCDADGYYWFVGRADDIIKTSGHLVGPFEVESVLMEHSTLETD